MFPNANVKFFATTETIFFDLKVCNMVMFMHPSTFCQYLAITWKNFIWNASYAFGLDFLVIIPCHACSLLHSALSQFSRLSPCLGWSLKRLCQGHLLNLIWLLNILISNKYKWRICYFVIFSQKAGTNLNLAVCNR